MRSLIIMGILVTMAFATSSAHAFFSCYSKEMILEGTPRYSVDVYESSQARPYPLLILVDHFYPKAPMAFECGKDSASESAEFDAKYQCRDLEFQLTLATKRRGHHLSADLSSKDLDVQNMVCERP